MNCGEWTLDSIMAGTFGLDGGAMFGVVPKALWAKSLPPDDANRIPMAMRLLLARGHGRTVLVDAGAGGGYDDKSEGIYGFEGHDDMRTSLAPAGVTPEDVTDVLLTHLHFDHGAGVAQLGEDGKSWRLVFPTRLTTCRKRNTITRSPPIPATAPATFATAYRCWSRIMPSSCTKAHGRLLPGSTYWCSTATRRASSCP